MQDAATDSPSAANPPTESAGFAGPFTLAVDIGGTNMKASVLAGDGTLAAERVRCPTPRTATPDAVLQKIETLARKLPPFDRISVGFPGVVKGARVLTAPNLGTEFWAGFNLIDALFQRFGTPVRMLNDAAVQGLGVVEGDGLACVITLGTGIGCALFRDRRLLLHLEFGQHLRGDQSYDRFLGAAALEAIGPEQWNARLLETVATVTRLTSCDVLYVGGGNSRRVDVALPDHVRVVSNAGGVTGGARLWEADLDEHFLGVPNAQWPAATETAP
jgi:polyphosphate glucokinase